MEHQLKIEYYVVFACKDFQRDDQLYWINKLQIERKLWPQIEKKGKVSYLA